MNWHSLYSTQRIGQKETTTGKRSTFQQDFDRIIFSSSFRRLQNKTQVFPLPGSTFVHNRLTHSLEVASVGRSLGAMVGEQLCNDMERGDCYEFYRYELANVIAAGCLAHDIGNPAFGHSGEKAISAYFTENADLLIDGKTLRSFFSANEWCDISNFEGNANAIRILTHQFKGKLMGGLGLTYTTIASILKYPCESSLIDKNFKHRKKYGFFQTEKETINNIAAALEMLPDGSEGTSYKRHPFVYLVEAADDICYSIIDMEDAHRLGILPHELVRDSFIFVIASLEKSEEEKTISTCEKIKDLNEKISYLRAKAINLLTHKAADVFLENKDNILSGNFNETLLSVIEKRYGALEKVMHISAEKIYNHDTVLEIEIAGYNVMGALLGLFVPPLLKAHLSHKDEKILKLFPEQYREFKEEPSPYKRIINAFDLISGMTDLYATEMYRKLTGIDIPAHR